MLIYLFSISLPAVLPATLHNLYFYGSNSLLWWISSGFYLPLMNNIQQRREKFLFLFTFSSFFCPFILTLTLKSNSLLCSYSSCFQTWTLVNSQVQVLPGVAFFHNRTFCVFDAFLELLTFIFGYGDTRGEHAGGRTYDCHSLNSPDSYSLYSHMGSIKHYMTLY